MGLLDEFKEDCYRCKGLGSVGILNTSSTIEYESKECTTCKGTGKLFKEINISTDGSAS